MRVNPNPLPGLISALQDSQKQINNDLLQIASGQKVSMPSDDPAAAAMLVRNADQRSEADQFLHSISSVQGEMQTADSVLSSVVTALQRAISLGVQGANGTLSDGNRAAIATEVRGIQSQLLNLANTSYQGNFIFAGTATQTTPFVLDASSPSGVRYDGNLGVNQVTVGSNLSVQSNLPGSDLFSAAGNDMFKAIQDLITGLDTGTGIDNAVTAVGSAYTELGRQRVFYGNAMNQLDAQQTDETSQLTQLKLQQNTVGGADLTAVIGDLTTAQTSHEATLAAISHVGQSNLFDYLK